MPDNQIWVDAWSPEYGSSTEVDAGLAPSQEDVEPEVELATWRPLTPPASPRLAAAFIDGVNRVEARAFLGNGGQLTPGLFGSVAAGAVMVDGTARYGPYSVERWSVFGDGANPELGPLDPGLNYLGRSAPGRAPEDLLKELQRARADLEQDLAAKLARGGYLVIADGPVRVWEPLDLVGYIKSHHTAYLEPQHEVVALGLESGQRTPLFRFGRIRPRYSWYTRIAGAPRQHPWAAIVRCEVSTTVGLARAVGLADEVTHHLPRFASKGFWDTRAPQNLVPIASLERRLWSLLGDRELVLRRIRSALYRG